MTEFIDIDGSMLEGGGQILRMSVSLSCILVVPIRVRNIRAGRSKPGLAAQHLVGIKLVADMCGAKLTGAHIGSQEIEFTPSYKIRKGHYVADTRTAGSISLLLQVALPCALVADGPITLDLKGGTNADMAPQIDYFTEILMKTLTRFGVVGKITVHRRGYFPKGGGHVTVQVEPLQKFRAVNLTEPGDIRNVYGWSFVAGTLPIKLAHEMVEGVMEEILPLHKAIAIQAYKEDYRMAADNCSGIIVACETTSGCVLGADALGRRGADARAVGRAAGAALAGAITSRACVDSHTQDQIILYMALADGKSVVRCGNLTLHTQTAIYISELIAKVKFLTRPVGDHIFLDCVGLGHINRHFSSCTVRW